MSTIRINKLEDLAGNNDVFVSDINKPSKITVLLPDGSQGNVQDAITAGDVVLRDKLLNLEYGAGIVFGSSRQVFGFDKLKTTIPRYEGDKVDVVSHTFPFPASGPVGARSFVWVSSSVATPDTGRTVKVDTITTGRWISQGEVFKDVDFGIKGDGTNESVVAQKFLDSVTSGSTILITKRFKAVGLVLAANSVRIDTNSAAYLESPGIDSFEASTLPLLKITGYGCTIGSLWISDASVDFGTINAGSIGVEFIRADGTKDLDAYVQGLNVSKFETGLHKVGINCRTLGGGNIFSHCLNSIVVDQVTEASVLQDVRGIVVGGGTRFHGRPTLRKLFGVTTPEALANSLGCDIVVNGTVQRENQFYNILSDGSGKFYKGQLGRRSFISAISLATPGGDAVTITGGISGEIDLLFIGGGEGNGLVFEGGSFINVGRLKIDTVFKHGVVLRNCTDISFDGYKVMNVSAEPAATSTYSGFSIESTATLTTLGQGRIRQTSSTSGNYGIDNQGNQTLISRDCTSINFTNGPINQSSSQRVYGDIGLMSNRPVTLYASTPPVVGTFGTGDRCINNSPSISNPVVCRIRTAASTWKVIESIAYSGSTAVRPVLLTEDSNVMYFDTTLGGKPIWWNGSAWKDATGATV